MSVIDKIRFEARGAAGAALSMYHLHRTVCCRRCCVEDEVLGVLYVDPQDLSKRVDLMRPVDDRSPFPCPFCGDVWWDVLEIEALSDVPAHWQWACFQH
jgi:hypothetical protein